MPNVEKQTELVTINRVVRTLNKLEDAQRARILDYLQSYYTRED